MSDYFAAMFTSDVREAKQDEVKMEGVDPDALWVLVQYAYTGTNVLSSPEHIIHCLHIFISAKIMVMAKTEFALGLIVDNLSINSSQTCT